MCLIELSLVHRFTDGFNSNSTQVHEDQSAHVKKGCLSHPHNDIASDGSCIGGPHKHWNSIMRSFTSDTAIMLAHCHNHVARYNIRRSTSCSWNWHSWRLQGLHLQLSPSTIGQSFRHTLEYSTQKIQEWVRHCKPPSTPNFSNVDSKEQFGLVESNHSIMFGGLLPQPKVEPKDEEDLLAVITGSDQIEIDSHFDDLKIYPVLLSQPERPLSGASTTTSIVVPTTIHGCEPAHAPSQLPDITIKWPNSCPELITELLLQDLTATTTGVGPKAPSDSQPQLLKWKLDWALDSESKIAKHMQFKTQPKELTTGLATTVVSAHVCLDFNLGTYH